MMLYTIKYKVIGFFLLLAFISCEKENIDETFSRTDNPVAEVVDLNPGKIQLYLFGEDTTIITFDSTFCGHIGSSLDFESFQQFDGYRMLMNLVVDQNTPVLALDDYEVNTIQLEHWVYDPITMTSSQTLDLGASRSQIDGVLTITQSIPNYDNIYGTETNLISGSMDLTLMVNGEESRIYAVFNQINRFYL